MAKHNRPSLPPSLRTCSLPCPENMGSVTVPGDKAIEMSVLMRLGGWHPPLEKGGREEGREEWRKGGREGGVGECV